jgi:hypothetical protein
MFKAFFLGCATLLALTTSVVFTARPAKSPKLGLGTIPELIVRCTESLETDILLLCPPA